MTAMAAMHMHQIPTSLKIENLTQFIVEVHCYNDVPLAQISLFVNEHCILFLIAL